MLLLNTLNLFSSLNMRNKVTNTNKQHVTLYITYINHYGFTYETENLKDELPIAKAHRILPR